VTKRPRQLAVVAIHGHFKQEVESGGVREFGLGAESAIARIEEFERCGDDFINEVK